MNLTSWKTTSAGVAAIAGAVITLTFAIRDKNVSPEMCTAIVTQVLTGVGLLFARDFDKSSEDHNLSKE